MVHHFLLAAILAAIGVCAASPDFASQAPNPTVCATNSVSPTPNGSICGVHGSISSPELLKPRIPATGPNPDQICRNECLETSGCVSYEVRLTYRNRGSIIYYPTCYLYNQTIAAQSFTPDPAKTNLPTFFDKSCFSVSCASQPPPSQTASACIPTYTNFIKDPSFETPSDVWKYTGKGASRITSNPAGAYSGSSYALLNQQGRGVCSVSQMLSNLNISQNYLLRFETSVTEANQTLYYCVRTFSHPPGTTSGDGKLSEKIYAPFTHPYQLHIGRFKPSTGSETIIFGLNCPSDTAAQVHLDSVSFNPSLAPCRFVLALRSPDSNINGQFLSIVPSGISSAQNLSSTLISRTQLRNDAQAFALDAFGGLFTADPDTADGGDGTLAYMTLLTPEEGMADGGTKEHLPVLLTSVKYFGIDADIVPACEISGGALNCSGEQAKSFSFCSASSLLFLDRPGERTGCSEVTLEVLHLS